MKYRSINRVLKSALALSITMHTVGNITHAQTGDASEAIQLEEIIVRGIRSSLDSAAEIKRNASSIVDSIVAEDIGKFPDENVAEALQRVPGVSISRSGVGGEGSGISIRGLGPNFSRVFVNGRTVLNAGTGRQVNFSDMPSEIVGRLDVHKTPMASLVEGSIGGSVNVITASPFDSGGGLRATASVQGVHNTLADNYKPRLSGQISNTFADDTVGVLFGINYQDRSIRQDQFDLPGLGWECNDATLDSRCAGDLSTIALEDRFFRPQFPRQFLQVIDSERMGVTGAIHFRPTDNAKLDFDMLYTSREDVFDQASVIIGTFSNVSDIATDPVTGDPLAIVNENNTIVQLQVEDADLRVNHRTTASDVETLVLGLNGELIQGPWTLSSDLSYSESSTESGAKQLQIFRELDGVWDYRTSSGVPEYTLFDDFQDNPTLNTGWSVNNIRDDAASSKQDEINIRLDAERELGGVFDSVQFGVRYTDGGLDRDAFGVPGVAGGFVNIRPRPTLEEFAVEYGAPALPATTLNDVLGIDNFGTELPGNMIPNWRVANWADAVPYFFAGQDPRDAVNWAATYTISETTNAAYTQLNFSLDDRAIPISGNIGVRYVSTEVKTTGGSAIADFLNLQEGEYSDTLPSANVRFDLQEDLVLRLSAAKTISRPSYSDLNPSTSVNTTTFAGTAGNPSLLPFRADQADLSLEWYFGGSGNVLALSTFYKDIESFIADETVFTTVAPELLAGEDPSTIVAITRPGNGEGASLKGFELTYQQAFDMLPAPWDGLGIVSSYTKMSTDATFVNSLTEISGDGLEGLSENAYNLTGYYEKHGWSFRMAYNWREEHLISTGSAIFSNDYGQLDAQLSYDISDRWTVTFDAKNINGENFSSYRAIPERLNTINTYGSRYFLGTRFRF